MDYHFGEILSSFTLGLSITLQKCINQWQLTLDIHIHLHVEMHLFVTHVRTAGGADLHLLFKLSTLHLPNNPQSPVSACFTL